MRLLLMILGHFESAMFSEGATCKLSTISKWFTESDSNCWICYFKWFITNNQYIRVIFHWHSTQVCIRCYLTKLNMDAHKAFPLVTNWEQIINYYCTFFCCICDNFSCSVDPWCSSLHWGRDISSWHLDRIRYWTHRWQSVFITMVLNVS